MRYKRAQRQKPLSNDSKKGKLHPLLFSGGLGKNYSQNTESQSVYKRRQTRTGTNVATWSFDSDEESNETPVAPQTQRKERGIWSFELTRSTKLSGICTWSTQRLITSSFFKSEQISHSPVSWCTLKEVHDPPSKAWQKVAKLVEVFM